MSSSRRHERTSARRSTVQVLYTSEIQDERPTVLLETGRCLEDDGPLSDYALSLIKGVEEKMDDIDARLEESSDNWAVSRMPVVDRSILRIAVYEMVYVDDVPVSVAINEAVELAKAFGGEDESPRFVNGVLGRIAPPSRGRYARGGACRPLPRTPRRTNSHARGQPESFEAVKSRLEEIVDAVNAEGSRLTRRSLCTKRL